MPRHPSLAQRIEQQVSTLRVARSNRAGGAITQGDCLRVWPTQRSKLGVTVARRDGGVPC